MKPHKHAEIIKAWADGHTIQMKSKIDERWWDQDYLDWAEDYEYRVKPEAKPDIVKEFYLEVNSFVGYRFSQAYTNKDLMGKFNRLRCVFDGETGKLKSAEVF